MSGAVGGGLCDLDRVSGGGDTDASGADTVSGAVSGGLCDLDRVLGGGDAVVSGVDVSACGVKGALYIIQILCRRYTIWSYPAGLTIADPPG